MDQIFSNALYELGVRDDTLSNAEKEALDRDGFVELKNVLTKEQAYRMRDAVEELFVLEKTGEPDGTPECSNIQNKSPLFDVCVTHPRLLAAIAHVLKEEFRSMGVHSRPNLPGRGHQGLHVDWGGAVPERQEYFACNSLWPFCDFTKENGATRVVPGSHRFPKPLDEAVADVMAPHPDEIQVVVPLGSVVVFNSHVWHSAMPNNTSEPRPNVTSFWRRRKLHSSEPPSASPWGVLDEATAARYNEATRQLFVVE